MSNRVRAGLAEQLSTGNHAEVCIRFYQERSPDQQRQQQEQQQNGEEGHVAADSLVGDPLLAHKVILTVGSTYFKAKLEKPCWQGLGAGVFPAAFSKPLWNGRHDEGQPVKRRKTEEAPLQQHPGEPDEESQGAALSALPEVLVPLSSEEEVPFARQAMEFIYTGGLRADLDFEALLRVRQQACYLGVEDCPQACDEAMLAWLQQPQQQQEDAAEDDKAAARPHVLIAYSCHALFPKPDTDDEPASFDAVRSALAKQLVSHFGDAVAALSRPDLHQQLLQLPAVAVKELLAADDFGTDSENSVFLLLACRLEEQEGVSGKTRAELWRLVRLHRLGRPYLHFVLPVYKPIIISRLDLGFLTQYVGAGEAEREQLLDIDSKRRSSPWYCSPARRQVVPEEGRTLKWSVSRKKLERGLRELLATKADVIVEATFGGSASTLGDTRGTRVLSRGLLWGVNVVLNQQVLMPEGPDAAAGHGAAGMYLVLDAPEQLGEVSGVAAAYAELDVYGWAQGQRDVAFCRDFMEDDLVQTDHLWGVEDALDLPPTAAAAAGGGEGRSAAEVDAEVAIQLARWSGWMHKGKITGVLTCVEE